MAPLDQRTRRPTLLRGAIVVLSLLFVTSCLDSGVVAPQDDSSATVRSEAAPTTALSTSAEGGLVISQVYGGGGNSGAPFQNDFVELFNASAGPVALTGLSIQYASATGTGNFGANTGLRVALPDSVLAPGQYFLIALAGGSNGVPLPPADANGTINMAGASGKVTSAVMPAAAGADSVARISTLKVRVSGRALVPILLISPANRSPVIRRISAWSPRDS